MADFLTEAKVGDVVMIQSLRDVYRATIARVTKHHVILEGMLGTKFNRNTGREVGGDTWSRRSLVPFNAEVWAKRTKELHEALLRSAVLNHDWRRCSMDLVEKVHALILETK